MIPLSIYFYFIFHRYLSVGPFAGVAACALAAFLYIMKVVCDIFIPPHTIEICPDYPTPKSSSKLYSKR